MDVLIEKTGKRMRIKFGGKVKTLLAKMKVNPETAIVVKNGELVTEDDSLNDKDTVKIMSVISGG